MDDMEPEQECCDDLAMSAVPRKPPLPPRDGQQFLEWQKCSCGTKHKLLFDTGTIDGVPTYAVLKIVESVKS
jgi:Ser/Thr protein kinase RdoA (MazF antagonist)